MTHADPPGSVPEPLVEENRPTENRRRISAIWLVPLAALLVSLAVAWQTYSQRGPLVEIVFDDASGIVAGQTRVRFRNMDIGLVEAMAFSEDLRQVVVSARIDRDLARFVDANSLFWAVRPQVTTQGVTGIETVLSGVYIDSFFDSTEGPRAERFTALPRPPLTPADQPGQRVRLRAPDGGSLNVGAPVLFKRIAVGTVEAVELTPEGDVLVDLFVDAPHDARLNTQTRFWNISGFSIELGTGGASFNVDSLLTLVQGGIAFDTIATGGEPLGEDPVFQLYASETAARQSVIEDDPAASLEVAVFFDGSIRGLQPGAPVEFRGVRVGEVTAIQTVVEANDDGVPTAATRTTLSLAPSRFGIAGDRPQERLADLLETRVAGGLRARIASANILTGALLVDLADEPDAEPAAFERDADPLPVMPSVPAEIGGFAASAEGVLERVANLPIEEILGGVAALIANVNALVTDDAIRAAPENLGLLLADMRALVGSDEIQAAPAELAALLASVRAVVETATEQELVAGLALALEETRRTIAAVTVAAEGVPELLAALTDLSREAQALALDELLDAATGLIARIEAVVGSEAVERLPLAVEAAIGEVEGLVADLRGGGTVENVNATLVSIRSIADDAAQGALVESLTRTLAEAERAAANVTTASEDLPALIDNLTRLSESAADLPLDTLIAATTDLVASVDGFVTAAGMEDLPRELGASLAELRLLTAELREGGAVENLNATLGAAEETAAAIREAVATLPALVRQLAAVADRADAVLSTLTPGSEINRDTLLLLREVRDTARSVNSLVSALERRPNSILFGR